jgi:prepilin-type N-terminal cleavage/methylation domain-containing protein
MNKKILDKKGFTLIELLVVIAIIGILAAVILASLNGARNRGSDGAIKQQLENMRKQGEIFYLNNSSSYSGACTSTGAGGLQTLIQNAMKNYNGTTTITGVNGTAATTSTGACHDSANGWAASIPLKSPSTAGNVWCVDSTGFSKEIALPTTSGTIGATGGAGVACQ